MSRGRQGSLRAYLVMRLLLTVPMVFILLVMVFLLMRVAPGNPIEAALGGKLSPAQLAARVHEAGFDKPLIVQFGQYLGDVFTGNFGTSVTDQRAITNVLAVNGAATLELTGAALFIAILVGIPTGLLLAHHSDSWGDAIGRVFSVGIYAAPVFVTGLVLQLFVGVKLGLLPTSGQASPIVQATMSQPTHILVVDALLSGSTSDLWDVISHLIMPAFVLGMVIAGVFTRVVRINAIQTLQADYVDAARARGIRERRVVVQHAFRNALVPVTTVMGLQAALLLSGAVLTEETFNWPGLGHELITYLNNRDYTAVQGIVTAFGLVVVVVSLLIDVVTALIDPRVRY
ncbi:MAG: ABC transporter permease [bacterium]|nr:ABC transporter permease [bacterium]